MSLFSGINVDDDNDDDDVDDDDLLPPFPQHSWKRLHIHHDPDQDKAVTDS